MLLRVDDPRPANLQKLGLPGNLVSATGGGVHATVGKLLRWCARVKSEDVTVEPVFTEQAKYVVVRELFYTFFAHLEDGLTVTVTSQVTT